jgi:outer membrane lipoprotein-sorting protein
MADRVREVLLEITPEHEIARIVIREADGASTEFRFSAQAEDVKVADKEFHFTVPAGVEVVSGELGQ